MCNAAVLALAREVLLSFHEDADEIEYLRETAFHEYEQILVCSLKISFLLQFTRRSFAKSHATCEL